MSKIKKLANQTLWYGLPTILTRFIGLTLSIVVLRKYPSHLTGDFQLIYVYIPILMILYTYGLETSYFRFAINENKSKLFNSSFSSIILTSTVFSVFIYLLSGPIAFLMGIPHQKSMIEWMSVVLFIDTISAIPYAKLRQEERPRKFAFVKMVMVITHFLLVVVIYNWWIPYLKTNPNGFAHSLYNGNDMLYFIIANAIGSAVAFVMLYSEYKTYKPEIDKPLMSRILKYSLPLVVVGFIGMSNDSVGRIIFDKFLDWPAEKIQEMRGILLTTFKLAMLINVFTQMFRIAAEPFFFSRSKDHDAKNTYSQSLILYIIISAIALIFVVFFKDLWLSIFTGKFKDTYKDALYILPILSLSMMLSGVYYTMTVWYKLTDQNIKGAVMAFLGLIVNVVFLLLLVKEFTYAGVAWANLISNVFLVGLSYFWGQKHYEIPYNWPKIIMHFVVLVFLIVVLGRWQDMTDSIFIKIGIGLLAFVAYLGFVLKTEKNIVKKLPFFKRI